MGSRTSLSLGLAFLVCGLGCEPGSETPAPTVATAEAPKKVPPSPERPSSPQIPLDRLLTPPSTPVSADGVPAPPSELAAPSEERSPVPWLEPRVNVRKETVEGIGSRVSVESREFGGGVTVTAPGQGPAISLEGGVKEDVSSQRPEERERQGTAGVKIEIPWPVDE